MHPILIDLGFFQLPSYGVMLATAVVVALWTLRLRGVECGASGVAGMRRHDRDGRGADHEGRESRQHETALRGVAGTGQLSP